eukprot:CAMPEP_0116149924 /NCGR_PEP_ID=MMETSP0329-20121206/19245_1 /TAXON_ID=697910 /ORGANISM="Pseudo-nitzschia arenysensis, Strain B593" /LENGTH=511 /DNA_ID=CAMNT_0003646347 /DNA_START=191 /DNA_END=1726 /DNA_ORIENTATION=-
MSTENVEDPAHARTRIYNHYDDEWNENPDQVEELLSRELLRLTLEDRNKFQDEIHGVHCIAPEETPELLRSSLQQIDYELEHVVPLDQKQAYLQSKTLNKKTYIHEDDFKLRFLRCELFDAHKAALRMALFIDLLVGIFGGYALERPIRLSDFSKNELCEFRKGRFQLLPDRDRGFKSGRRVICIFPDKGWEQIPPKTRHKIAMYQLYVAGSDIDVQRKGFVFVVWFDSNLESSWKPMMTTKMHQIPCVRITGVHICTPDTPFFRLRRSLAIMASGNHRTRLRIHIGESMEMRYFLRAFGVPSEKLPITYSGTIKTANLKKWLRFRHLQEDERYYKTMLCKDNTNTVNNSKNFELIECPYLTDILFRKGKNFAAQPGNALLRQVIKSKIESGIFDTNGTYKTRQFVTDIIEELKQGGATPNNPPIRLLEWNDVNGYFWREIHDYDLIYNKIRHVVKEFQSIVKEEKGAKRKKQAMLNQGGGTSLFQYQDGSYTSTPCACLSDCQTNVKKQK